MTKVNRDMLFKAKFPAFLESATVPRFKHPRPVFRVFETDIDISVMGDEDIPVVLKTHEIMSGRRPGQHREFRACEGRFYQQTQFDVSDLQQFVFDMPFNRFGAVGRALYAQAQKARPFEKLVLPGGIVGRIEQYGDVLPDYSDFYGKLGSSVPASTESRASMFEAESAFQAACRSTVLIDGMVWTESPEPLLAVGLRDGPGHVMCVAPRLPVRSPIVFETQRPGLDKFLFTFAQHEEAMELAISLFDRGSPWRAGDFVIDHITPGHFSATPPLGDALGQLEQCLRLPHLDEAASLRLESFLADDGLWTEALVQEEIAYVLSTFDERSKWMVASLEYEKARYEAKPIDILDTARSATPKA